VRLIVCTTHNSSARGLSATVFSNQPGYFWDN
jgi:hypothetical protein